MRVSDKTFDGWVIEYTPLLYRIAYWWTGSTSEAEELTQEAFFQAYKSRETLRDIGAVKAWLVKILRFCFTRELRRQKSASTVPLDAAFELEGGEGADLEAIALRGVLQNLEEHYRDIVVLFYFQELSYKEIAEVMDIPIGTVMSRLSRGRQLLHEKLRSKPRPATVKEIRRA